MNCLFRFIGLFGFLVMYSPMFAQTELLASEYLVVSEVKFVGNHRTKSSVIEHELSFSQGDTIISSKLLELISMNKTNILKTSLFNFVDITHKRHDGNLVDVEITVQERWYIIPRLKIKTVEENINAWLVNADLNHLSLFCSVSDENFRGYHENLSIIGSIGFNKSVGLRYFKPEIFKKSKIGLGAEVFWIGNNESINGYFDYKPKFVRTDRRLLTQYLGTLLFQYRPTQNIEEQFLITYNNVIVADTLIRLNPSYFSVPNMELVHFNSMLKFDYRDSKPYPLKGVYFDVIFDKQLTVNRVDDEIAQTSIMLNGRYYKKLAKKWYGAIGTTALKSWINGSSNFLSNKIGQTGMEIRSFEYYLIPVDLALIGRMSLKYQIVNKPKKTIDFISNKKFGMFYYAIYASLFADGAYVTYNQNGNFEQEIHLTNNWLSSLGAGFDLSTYYDFVLRMEYSYNCVFNKGNFVFHFKSAI